MNKLMQFEDTNVNMVQDENGNLFFELYSTGMALGYVKYAKDKAYPKKDRIDIIVKNAEITSVVQSGQLFLTESQLYDFMLEAHTNKCKKFKKWLTNIVLPTIHKTGGYVSNDELFINTYLSYADENTKNLFRLQLNTITQLNHKIEQDKPLVDFAEQVSSTTDLIDIGALSKLLRKQGLNIGRNKLFEWLRDNKFLRPNNEPYQQYISQGYFKTKESTYFVGSEPKITIKTFVTGKGQQYIFDKLSNATIE